MPRHTIGEELQDLFRRHEAGLLPDEAFTQRKAALLRTSACRLPAMMPDPLRAAKAFGVAALAVPVLWITFAAAGGQ